MPAAESVRTVQTVLEPEQVRRPVPQAPGEHDAGAMSSMTPLQSLSMPSQTSAEGAPGVAEHDVPSVRLITSAAVARLVDMPSPTSP